MSLDLDPDGFRALLGQASDLVVGLSETGEERPVSAGADPEGLAARFDEPLPQEPLHVDALLERVERDVFANATLSTSPRFLSYIMSGGCHVGVAADLLVAGLDQNCALWPIAPSAVEVERRAVAWLAEFVGYPAGGGIVVSGGSAADLHGLAAAVVDRAGFDVLDEGLRAGPPLAMYVSEEGHSALDKSVRLLGLGQRHLRKIPTRGDFTVDVDRLVDAVERDRAAGLRPICVIGNAGTVNTGAIDDLDALATVAAEHDLWFHVDAAYGGPAAGTRRVGRLFAGLDRADSVALDPHKWLYAPFDAGCVLVRDPAALRRAFSVVPDYLQGSTRRDEPSEHGFELSRRFRALKVWMGFLAYGAAGLRAAIEDNLDVMAHLAALVDAADDLELAAPAPLSVVCLRYRPPGLDDDAVDAVNTRLPAAIQADGRVFVAGTRLGGRPVLRACSVNHRLERRHVELAAAVVRDLGRRLADA